MARQARASASRGGKVRRIAFRVAIAAASLFVLVALLFAPLSTGFPTMSGWPYGPTLWRATRCIACIPWRWD